MHCRKRPREEDYEREDISKKIKTVNYEDTNLSSWDSEKIITALNYMDIDKENKIGDFSVVIYYTISSHGRKSSWRKL